MFEPGMHPVHRTAFLTGVLAYASSPLWLAFLILSSYLFAQHAGNDPTYFIEPYQLFPIWPTADLKLMLTLFGLTGILLLAPKALSLAAIVWRGDAHRFGGVGRLLGSAAIEFLHSMLLAPVRMLFHSQFVFAALTGLRLDWKSPPRDDAATGWHEAWMRHGIHTLLTVFWITAIVVGSDAMPWWLSPILLGLLGAMPLSVWGSRVAIGRALRRRGLLLTPEEMRTPAVIDAATQASAAVERRLASFRSLLTDRPTRAGRGLDGAPERRIAAGAKSAAEATRIDRALVEGPDALSRDDRLRLLSSRAAMQRLQREIHARRAHPGWWLADASPPRPASDRDPAVPSAAGQGSEAVAPSAGQ